MREDDMGDARLPSASAVDAQAAPSWPGSKGEEILKDIVSEQIREIAALVGALTTLSSLFERAWPRGGESQSAVIGQAEVIALNALAAYREMAALGAVHGEQNEQARIPAESNLESGDPR